MNRTTPTLMLFYVALGSFIGMIALSYALPALGYNTPEQIVILPVVFLASAIVSYIPYIGYFLASIIFIIGSVYSCSSLL